MDWVHDMRRSPILDKASVRVIIAAVEEAVFRGRMFGKPVKVRRGPATVSLTKPSYHRGIYREGMGKDEGQPGDRSCQTREYSRGIEAAFCNFAEAEQV